MIKVIGAGFGRTGTTSLKLALERLGFGPCYHFTEMLRCRHAPQWLRIARGNAPDWDRLLGGFAATTDWPAAAWYKALSVHYPDARVILTVRDRDAWHASICNALLPLRHALNSWLRHWLPGVGTVAELADTVVWDGTFDGRAEDRTHALTVFDRHCAEVRAAIAPNRLLVFDVREGWQPLCEFLDVPVPDGVPFPRTNDTATMRRIVAAMKLFRLIAPSTLAIALIVLLVWLT